MRRAPPLLLALTLGSLTLGCGDKADDSGDPAGTGGEAGDGTGGGAEGDGSGGGTGDEGGGTGDEGGGTGEDGGDEGGGSGGEEGGGEEGGDDGTSDPLVLIGSWTDQEGSEHVISETAWVIDFGAGEQYSYALTAYDNAAGWVVGENGSGNVGEVGYWSRFDFAVDGGGTAYICQTTALAADEAAALATAAADVSGAPSSDCPGWGWQRLSPL
jgi:hypothetical protein